MKMIRLGTLAEMDVLEAKARAYEMQKFVEHGGVLKDMDTHAVKRLTFGAFIENALSAPREGKKEELADRGRNTATAYSADVFGGAA